MDGFKIAEMDLQLRGGGVIAGLEQAGELDFKLADIKKDHRLFMAARTDARLLLENKKLQNDDIKNYVTELAKKIKNLSFS